MTDTRPVVLKAEHLGITFGGLKAVSDFNMEIHEGELMGLIGPNGAGKTTVFNLLTGVYVPTEGAFYLCGQKLNGKQTFAASGWTAKRPTRSSTQALPAPSRTFACSRP